MIATARARPVLPESRDWLSETSEMQSGNFHDLPIGGRAPHVVSCYIEVPRGSVNKYEYGTRHVKAEWRRCPVWLRFVLSPRMFAVWRLLFRVVAPVGDAYSPVCLVEEHTQSLCLDRVLHSSVSYPGTHELVFPRIFQGGGVRWGHAWPVVTPVGHAIDVLAALQAIMDSFRRPAPKTAIHVRVSETVASWRPTRALGP